MSWYAPELQSFTNPTILVIGFGTVGRAICRSLVNGGVRVVAKDANKSTRIEPISSTQIDGVIICVDTPTDKDGHCDTENVRRALTHVRAEYGAPHVMVKSTMPPEAVVDLLPDNAIYSPEFVRGNNAYNDFTLQPFMLLGGDPKENKFWKWVFKYLKTEFIDTTPEAASWTKYLHNTFLATKVAFFHSMDLAAHKKGDTHNFYEALGILQAHDEQVGPSHLFAPNSEGDYGYAGACFPKDMTAFATYTDDELLQKVIEYNERLRNTKPD